MGAPMLLPIARAEADPVLGESCVPLRVPLPSSLSAFLTQVLQLMLPTGPQQTGRCGYHLLWRMDKHREPG